MRSQGWALLGVIAAALTVPVSAGAASSAASGSASSPTAALDAAIARATEQNLASEPAWLRLGHYRRTAFGGWRSEADGVSFFIAANGKNDPAEELEATLRAFFAKPATFAAPETPHAQCRFPARLEYLVRAVPIDPATLPRTECPKLAEFVTRVAARSVTFTFSSYYLGNPSSAFGHTLLRLNKDESIPDGKRKELLDWGVNYAGAIDTKNPFLYAMKGFFGGFRGTFSTVPYFYKVREYNDFETRDLYEYRLALTSDEVQRLVLHLWELGGTWFDYYYLDENCSYQLLAALEAAAPRLNLMAGLKPYVLPADAVKVLYREGLVAAATWRPSLRSTFEWRTAALTAEELALVRTLEADPAHALPPTIVASEAAQARVLDAAVDLLDLQHARALIFKTDPEPAKRRHALLVRRSRLRVASEERPHRYPQHRAPERSHGTVRLGFGGGASLSGDGPFARLTIRPALHDLLDLPDGYPTTTVMEVAPIELRYDVRRAQVVIEDAQLLRIANLAPVTGFWPSAAWSYQAGAQTIRDGGCDAGEPCLAGAMQGGVGVSVTARSNALLLYAFADGQLAAGPQLRGLFDSRFRPSVGPRVGARWHLTPWFSTGVTASAWAHFEASPRLSWSAQWEGRLHANERFSFDVRVRRTQTGIETAGGVQTFF